MALSAAKGATLHRKSGLLFVCAVVTMSLSGAAISAYMANGGNVLVLLAMVYWLWRVRVGRNCRGIVGVNAPGVI